jgi:hypothetical protein
MTPNLATSLPIPQALLFFVLVAAFWFPAWRWLNHSNGNLNEHWCTRAAFAFVIAFGLFSAISGPLLLCHASTQTALYVLLPSWVLCLIGAEWNRRKQTLPAPSQHATDPAPQWSRPTYPGFFLGAVLLGLAVATAATKEWIPRRIGLGLLGLGFAVSFLLAWRSRKNSCPPIDLASQTTGESKSIWDHAITLLLLSLVLATLITPAFHFRADADDNLYLSEALLLTDSPAMGLEAPTHRGEGLTSNPLYSWQSFELWVALLARFAGLHPLMVLRSLLGPLLVLLCLSLYRGILRRILPQQLLPAAMVFLVAYFLFGTSSHWTPNNYLLSRPQQGKTWLMHLGVAAILLQSMLYLECRNVKQWLLLLLTSFACLGWAPTAVLLVPGLLGTFALSQLFVAPSLATLRRQLPMFACILPQLLFAILLFTQQDAIQKESTLDWGDPAPWQNLFILQFLNGGMHGGALELAALILAPLLVFALPRLRRQAYPLWFSVALGCVLLNPLFYQLMCKYISGEPGYLRFFWLLPLPFFIASLGAVLVELGARTQSPGPSRFAGLTLGLLVFPLCGAHYVWSPENVYYLSDSGTYLGPVDNPYKMPAGLLDTAQELTALPLGPDHRILCHISEVMHLSPLVHEFDFVFARDYQTLPPLWALGRDDEADRRLSLGIDFMKGALTDEIAAPLLAQEKAEYVIVGPDTAGLEIQLERLNYSLRFESGEFSLWVKS